VLGDKEAGKSSTLGWLLRRGVPVLSDDLVVWDGTHLFAGPACVDLREGAAEHLGGRDVGVLGGRRRWRLAALDSPGTVPLGGLVYLRWGDEPSVASLDPAGRLLALFDNVVCGLDGRDASDCLDLAALPAWTFTRPRSFDRLDEALDRLLTTVG
jgi:hypothetical protein